MILRSLTAVDSAEREPRDIEFLLCVPDLAYDGMYRRKLVYARRGVICMLFTGITDVLNQGWSEDRQRQAPSGTCTADSVAAHVVLVGMQACRLIVAYVPSHGICVVSVFTSPGLFKPRGSPTLIRGVELNNKV